MSETSIPNTGWCAIPGDYVKAWTFRAIHNPYKRAYMELLHDRQSWSPPDRPNYLVKAAIDHFIPIVREETKTMRNNGSIRKRRMAPNGLIVTTFVRESGGYLHGAFFIDEDRFFPDPTLEGKDTATTKYNQRTPDDLATWVSESSIPDLGGEVTVHMNALGRGIVTGYFVENGFQGVQVFLLDPPGWWIDQNDGENKHALVFGREIGA